MPTKPRSWAWIRCNFKDWEALSLKGLIIFIAVDTDHHELMAVDAFVRIKILV